MLKYVLRRIAEVIPTTAGIVLLAFALFNIVGGSPAEVILGKNATAEAIAAFNHKFGYDKPLIVGKWGDAGFKGLFDSQLFNFVGDLAKGDLGYSVEMKEPVVDILKRGVGPSL